MIMLIASHFEEPLTATSEQASIGSFRRLIMQKLMGNLHVGILHQKWK